jgi:hypothetical protein
MKAIALAAHLTAVTQAAGDWIQLLRGDVHLLGNLADLGTGSCSHLLEELSLALTATSPLATGTPSRRPAPRTGAGVPTTARAEAAQRVLYLLALRIELSEPLFQQFLCLLYGL